VARAAGAEREPQGWQQGLDKALLDVDATPEERLQGLAKAASSPFEIAQALAEAGQAIANGKGRPAALDVLFPKGTIARSDLDGLEAVARQVPELLEGLQGTGRAAPQASTTRSSSSPKAPELKDLTDAAAKLLSPDTLREVGEEARNIFRRTPSGLEQPAFQVAAAGEGFEVRRYSSFTVATRRMAAGKSEGFSDGEGFSALATYLFGDNERERAMKMTMPVEIGYDSSAPEARKMAFVLPSEDVEAADGPPRPRDPTIEVAQVPERLVAVREFAGVATAGEVERQFQKLLSVLEEDGAYAPEVAGRYSVLQYNPPYTLPWRRRNEIAVVVTAPAEEAPSGVAPAQEGVARSAVTTTNAEGQDRFVVTDPPSGD